MPIWFIQALGATLFWAVGYNFVKLGFKNLSPLWNNIIANAFTVVFWLIPVLYLSNFTITIPDSYGFLLIFLIAVAYSSFPYAVSQGQISLSTALFSMYPVVTVLLSVIFLKEHLSALQALGVFFALMGCGCITWPTEKLSVKSHSWIFWGAFGAILSGFGDFLLKISTDSIGAYSNIFFMVIFFNICSILNYWIDVKGRKLPKLSKKSLWPTMVAWCFILSGGLLFLLAFETGPASLVSTVSGTNPALVAILAVIFLKEKLTRIHIAGIISIVVSIILIAVGTS